MDSEQNKDLYFICECGKSILIKNRARHLKSMQHQYWRLKKDAIERLGDWADLNTDNHVYIENPMNASKT